MIWSQIRSASPLDYLIAAFLTAVASLSIAYSIYLAAPWGCDANAWLCLFPISLIGIGPVAAVIMPILFSLNRRRTRALPDGLLPFVVLVGLVSQAVVSGYSLWQSEEHMRRIFFYDVLIFPHGLAAGALAGAVFWCALYILNKRREKLRGQG